MLHSVLGICYRPLGLHCDMCARCCLRPYIRQQSITGFVVVRLTLTALNLRNYGAI